MIPEGKLLLATGGDDNCLVISIVSLQENNSIKIDTKCQQLSAHAAQITGKCQELSVHAAQVTGNCQELSAHAAQITGKVAFKN